MGADGGAYVTAPEGQWSKPADMNLQLGWRAQQHGRVCAYPPQARAPSENRAIVVFELNCNVG